MVVVEFHKQVNQPGISKVVSTILPCCKEHDMYRMEMYVYIRNTDYVYVIYKQLLGFMLGEQGGINHHFQPPAAIYFILYMEEILHHLRYFKTFQPL